MNFFEKIKRRWMKLRLQPIRIFCLHHVSKVYDAESMNLDNWMQIDEFKKKINTMRQEGVEFISLTNAYHHICNDSLRFKRYAVLTFDDGYTSLKEILPWLEEQTIPAALFINGKYLDGKSYRTDPKEQYLTEKELFSLPIEIGSHGWEHMDASVMTEREFAESMDANIRLLSKHPRYIPYHAYTWGHDTKASDKILREKNIIPVLVDGMKNFNDKRVIHRELLDV